MSGFASAMALCDLLRSSSAGELHCDWGQPWITLGKPHNICPPSAIAEGIKYCEDKVCLDKVEKQ